MTQAMSNRVAILALSAIAILGLCSCSSEEVEPWQKDATKDQIRVSQWGRSNGVMIHLLRQAPAGATGGTLDVHECTDAQFKEFVDHVASPDTFLVTEVRITASEFTDVGMRELPRFKEATTVFLDGTGITGQGLSHLKDLTRLEVVSLRGTRVTGPALAYLVDLPNLRYLTLSGCDLVADRGLIDVAAMKNLVELLLEDTGITDTGLSKLHGMTKLRVINIENNVGITKTGVELLKAALPNLRVFSDHWQPPPPPPPDF